MTRKRIARPPSPTSDDRWGPAYEASLDDAWTRWERGDWLVALVYAGRSNDHRLATAMLDFARERAGAECADEASLAVLEVAEATLAGRIERDVCERIADNLRQEAFDTLLRDKRLDRYFGAHCVSSAARLAAKVRDPSSLRDAVDVIRAAVSQSKAAPGADAATGASHGEDERADAVRLRAAACIRGAIPRP